MDDITFLCYYCSDVDTCPRAYEQAAAAACVEADAIESANIQAAHSFHVKQREFEHDRAAWQRSDRTHRE